MNRWQIAILATTSVLVGLAVFLFWDRVADGPFPYKSKAVRYFAEHGAALDLFADRMQADGDVFRMICYPDTVWIEHVDRGPGVELVGSRLEEYLNLCRSSGGDFGWQTDRGFLFYMTYGIRDGRYFLISFHKLDELPDDRLLCSKLAQLNDFGKCEVQLGEHWVLDYEWQPKHLPGSARDKAERLAEDIVRDATNGSPP